VLGFEATSCCPELPDARMDTLNPIALSPSSNEHEAKPDFQNNGRPPPQKSTNIPNETHCGPEIGKSDTMITHRSFLESPS